MGAAERGTPSANCTVTNVPGPRDPLYFAGARLVTMIGMGPVTDGMGLIHPITSYVDDLIIAATSCREMMPDPGFYAECIENVWGDLMTATSGSRSPRAPAARRAASKPAQSARKKKSTATARR
jgi:hypothetical protein